MFNKEVRLALFVDGFKLYYATRALGFDIDLGLLRQEFQKQGHLVSAYYYTTLLESEDQAPVRPLFNWLGKNGYQIRLKTVKMVQNGCVHSWPNGSSDIELAVDALEIAPKIDHAVILTGNGDYSALVRSLQARNVRVSVVSTSCTSPPMVSNAMLRQADQFIELDALKAKIAVREGVEAVHKIL